MTTTTLAQALTATSGTVTVAAGTLALNDLLAVGAEFLQVTELLTATQGRVQRGVNGTLGASHEAGATAIYGSASLFITGPQLLPPFGGDGSALIGQGPEADAVFTTGVITPGGADGSIQYNNAGAFGGFGSWTGSLLTLPNVNIGTPQTTIDWEFSGYPSGPDPFYSPNQYVGTITTQGSSYVSYGEFNALAADFLTVNLAADDADYNSYAARVLQAVIPSGATKNVSELYGGMADAEFHGSGTLGYLTGFIGNASHTSDIATAVKGLFGYVNSYADAESLQALTGQVLADGGTYTYISGGGYQVVANDVTADYWVGDVVSLQATGATAITNGYAFRSEALPSSKITNGYYFWADAQGVFRIRDDNTFDAVYQAIPALYNPQFTKYTPGATNYERIVQQWNGNVAEIGTEKGGTGTLRDLRLLAGTGLQVQNGSGTYVPVTASDFIVSGSRFKSDTTDAHTGGLAGYDVDGAVYRDILTWTNGNAVAAVLGIPTGGSLSVNATSYAVGGAAGLTRVLDLGVIGTITIVSGLITASTIPAV